MKKLFVSFALAILVLGCTTTGFAQKRNSSTLFRVINCQVSQPDGTMLEVAAFRSMKNVDEVILIARHADHALLVDFGRQKAYKVPKPFPGSNAVAVPDERPSEHGNVGFMVRNVKGKKDLTEIIVHFKNDTCFLCGAQSFAAIWD